MNAFRRVCLLLLIVSSAGMAADTKPRDLWLHGRVSIDAEGRVADLAWDKLAPVEALVANRITAQVKSWDFAPAIVDGKPMPTQTGLMVHMQASEDKNGSVDLRFVGARTGAMAATLAPPSYPADAVRAGASALVVVDVSIDADGHPVVHGMRYKSNGNAGKAYRNEFLAATEAGMKAWSFRPEVAAGKIIPATFAIPVVFCLDSCRDLHREARAMTQHADLPTGVQLADDSAVSLKTIIGDPG